MAKSNELKITLTTKYNDEGLKKLQDKLVELKKNLLDIKQKSGTKSQAFVDEQKNILDLQNKIKQYSDVLRNQKKQDADETKRIEKEKAEVIKQYQQAVKQEKKQAIEEQKKAEKDLLAQQKADEREALDERKRQARELLDLQKAGGGKYAVKLGTLGAIKEEINYLMKYRETLQKTDPELNRVNQRILELKESKKQFGQVTRASTFQLMEFGENLVTVGYGAFKVLEGIGQMIKAFKDLTEAGAQFGVLKDNFSEMVGGTEQARQELELMQVASAYAWNEQKLIQYSAKMKLLGFTSKDTAKLLDIVDVKGDQVNATFEEGTSALQSYIMTGRGRALKDLGINIAEVKAEVERLTTETGKSKDSLDEYEEQSIRTKAIINLYGREVKDITGKTLDQRDKLNMLTTATENAKLELGNFITIGLTKLMDALGATDAHITGTVGKVSAIGSSLASLLPTVAMVQMAFPKMGSSIMTAMTGAGAIAVAKAGLIVASITAMIYTIKLMIDQANKIKEQERANDWFNKNQGKMIVGNIDQDTYNKYKDALQKGQYANEETKKIMEESVKSFEANAYDWQGIVNQYTPGQKETIKNLELLEKRNSELSEAQKKVNVSTKAGQEELTKINKEIKQNSEEINKLRNLGIEQEKKTGGTGKLKDVDNKEEEYKTTDEILELETKLSNLYKDKEYYINNNLRGSNIYYKVLKEIWKVEKEIADLKKKPGFGDIIEYSPVKEDIERKEIQTKKAELPENILKPVAELSVEELALIEHNKVLIETFENLSGAVSVFFESLASGEGALTGLKNVLKMVLLETLNFIQIQFLGANVSAIIQDIITMGFAEVKNAPLRLAAFLGIEALKGAIQGFSEGGVYKAGVPRMTGEKGVELDIPKTSGRIVSNKQLQMLLKPNNNVNNVYISSNLDAMKFMEEAFPQYINKLKFGRVTG